jgi:hypothetical protein
VVLLNLETDRPENMRSAQSRKGFARTCSLTRAGNLNSGMKNPAASFEAPGAPFRDDEIDSAFDQTCQRRFSNLSFVHGTFR